MYWNLSPRTPHLAQLRLDYAAAETPQERADIATRIRWIETIHELADAYKARPTGPLKREGEEAWISP